MTALRCSNPARWHPTLHRVEDHHNPPRSWTADDGASSEMVTLCGLCHNEVHACLDLFVHAGGPPAAAGTKTYSPFIRALAGRAWDRRIPGQTPYTLAHPDYQELAMSRVAASVAGDPGSPTPELRPASPVVGPGARVTRSAGQGGAVLVAVQLWQSFGWAGADHWSAAQAAQRWPAVTAGLVLVVAAVQNVVNWRRATRG